MGHHEVGRIFLGQESLPVRTGLRQLKFFGFQTKTSVASTSDTTRGNIFEYLYVTTDRNFLCQRSVHVEFDLRRFSPKSGRGDEGESHVVPFFRRKLEIEFVILQVCRVAVPRGTPNMVMQEALGEIKFKPVIIRRQETQQPGPEISYHGGRIEGLDIEPRGEAKIAPGRRPHGQRANDELGSLSVEVERPQRNSPTMFFYVGSAISVFFS